MVRRRPLRLGRRGVLQPAQRVGVALRLERGGAHEVERVGVFRAPGAGWSDSAPPPRQASPGGAAQWPPGAGCEPRPGSWGLRYRGRDGHGKPSRLLPLPVGRGGEGARASRSEPPHSQPSPPWGEGVRSEFMLCRGCWEIPAAGADRSGPRAHMKDILDRLEAAPRRRAGRRRRQAHRGAAQARQAHRARAHRAAHGQGLVRGVRHVRRAPLAASSAWRRPRSPATASSPAGAR